VEKPKIFISQPPAAVKKLFCDEALDILQSFALVTRNKKRGCGLLTENELSAAIKDVDGLITGWEGGCVTKNNLTCAKKLRVMGLIGTSVKHIEPEFAIDRGITVLNTAPALSVSVSEYTLAHILSSLHDITRRHLMMTQNRSWNKCREGFSNDLRHKNIGLIGVGLIGSLLIGLLKPFKVKIIAYDPYLPKKRAKELEIEMVSLEKLMATSQIISIHAGLTNETRKLVSREMLNLMHDGTLLVNTARGKIIDQKALFEIAKKKKIKVALDVFEQEPLSLQSKFRKLPNVILTPHSANFNNDTYRWVGLTLAEDLKKFFSGRKPENAVFKERLPLMT